jgi:hypothetical protein
MSIASLRRWVTDFIDRYFVSDPTADSLRAIMLLAALRASGQRRHRFRVNATVAAAKMARVFMIRLRPVWSGIY